MLLGHFMFPKTSLASPVTRYTLDFAASADMFDQVPYPMFGVSDRHGGINSRVHNVPSGKLLHNHGKSPFLWVNH